MKLKLLLLSLFVIFSISSSFAGLFIEPMLGYGTAEGDSKPDATTGLLVEKYEYDMSGPMYGIKAGGLIGPIKLGLDYKMFTGDLDITVTTTALAQALGAAAKTKASYDGKASLLGAMIGTNIPFVKFWGSYYISGEFEAKPKTGGSTSTYTGKGYSVGAGFSPIPMFSINLEMSKIKLDEVETAGVTTKLSGDQAVDLTIMFIYLSMPIAF